MKKLVLTFGAISGAAAAAVFILGSVLAMKEGALGQISGYFGFLLMLVALSVIFVGVKRYRDREQGGVITFGKAFKVGLGMSFIAGLAYVLCWEIYIGSTGYTFFEDYSRSYIEGRKAAGVAGEELEAVVASMETMKQRYANPLARVVMSFLEIFPFGVVVSLVAAGVLRRKAVQPASVAS